MYQPQNNYTNSYNPRVSALSFPAVMQKVYVWMTLALVMTGLTSYAVASSGLTISLLGTGNGTMLWVLMAVEVALVWFLSARIAKMAFMTAGLLFALYAILNGVTLSVIFYAFSTDVILKAFLTTAGTFGAMSFVGLFIKKDLSMLGRVLSMAVIGLIIALVVNMFWGNSMFDLLISLAGVVIFTGLTAYDTQKIKYLVTQYSHMDEESTMKVALMGSLTLYLDFVNLFLYLLRLFGRRR